MATVARAESPLYLQIAESMTQQVARGALRPGDRVPSLRRLSRQRRVSMSTALQAYLWLESRGYLEARPQSGFYVRTPFSALIPEPQFESPKTQPKTVTTNAILAELMESANNPTNIPLGAGCASPELYPNRRLNLILRRIVRREPEHSARYDFPPGVEALRRQIARRSPDMGCNFSPRDITVTCGALEALSLSLRAVAKPGDVIAMESPTYFGILESAASLGMKIIEIPTNPQSGMDLNQLEAAIRKHCVKACVVMTNSHNPLGYVLPDHYKKALVDVTARWNVPLIEDDTYGDLAHQDLRPRTAKSFDRNGLVILYSSFSKILSPGYRIGWVGGGRPFSGGRGTAEAADFCGQTIVAAECDCGILGDWRLRSLPQTAAHTIGRASRERPPGDREIFSSRHADQPPGRWLHAVDRVPAANQCPQAVSRRLGGKHQHPAGNYLFSNWAIQESHSD